MQLLVLHLGGLSDELYAGWQHAVKKATDEVFVLCINSSRHGVEPGQHKGAPTQ